MKTLLLICAGLLFVALINLPIGYYTFLRIAITVGSIAVIASEYEKGIKLWAITFGLIAIIFNPIIPIYLYDKSTWMPIDIICGIIFVAKALTINTTKNE